MYKKGEENEMQRKNSTEKSFWKNCERKIVDLQQLLMGNVRKERREKYSDAKSFCIGL